MGYIDQIDRQYHEDTPVKVVTRVRRVIYHHDTGTSEGLETVEEILVHSSNVPETDPIVVPKVKHVDDRSPRQKRRDHRQKEQEQDESYLQDWAELQQERRERK